MLKKRVPLRLPGSQCRLRWRWNHAGIWCYILLVKMATITDSALVIVNNDTVWTTTGTAAFCVTDLTINYEVYIEGYYPNIGVLTIPPYPVILEIIMNPIFSEITFFVNCCGEPLEGMMLTIGTVTVITGADGLATFNLTEGDYTFEINGYIFTFSVPETTYIDADICSEVTFHVDDEQGNLLDEVNININGGNLVTDYTGEADTCLQVGNYTYVAFKTGYVTQTGIIEADTLPQIIEIVMPVISYGVTFHVFGFQCNNEFEGLIIIINGDTLLPGETINLANGTYNYYVVLIGCGFQHDGMVIINNAPVTIYVYLPADASYISCNRSVL